MKLNLGCGTDIKPGYINIDVRKTVESVVVCDLTKPLPFLPASVEEIFACDILEHMSFRLIQTVLKDWFRVLQPGGKLFIQSPHLFSMCTFALSAKSVQEREKAIARFFGGQNYPENTHMTAIDEVVISHQLKEAGFSNEMEFTAGNFGNRTNIRITIFKQG